MNKALIVAAILEIATGVALVILPALVGPLLLGEALTGLAVPIARVAGIALIALGIACWPGPPLLGMVIYGGAVTVYLGYIGVTRDPIGIALWPTVALHLSLTGALAYDFAQTRGAGG